MVSKAVRLLGVVSRAAAPLHTPTPSPWPILAVPNTATRSGGLPGASMAYMWYSAATWDFQPDQRGHRLTCLFEIPIRPLVSRQLLSAITNCWQQISSVRVDASVLPAY